MNGIDIKDDGKGRLFSVEATTTVTFGDGFEPSLKLFRFYGQTNEEAIDKLYAAVKAERYRRRQQANAL